MIVRTWAGSYIDPAGRWGKWLEGWLRYLWWRLVLLKLAGLFVLAAIEWNAPNRPARVVFAVLLMVLWLLAVYPKRRSMPW